MSFLKRHLGYFFGHFSRSEVIFFLETIPKITFLDENGMLYLRYMEKAISREIIFNLNFGVFIYSETTTLAIDIYFFGG